MTTQQLHGHNAPSLSICPCGHRTPLVLVRLHPYLLVFHSVVHRVTVVHHFLNVTTFPTQVTLQFLTITSFCPRLSPPIIAHVLSRLHLVVDRRFSFFLSADNIFGNWNSVHTAPSLSYASQFGRTAFSLAARHTISSHNTLLVARLTTGSYNSLLAARLKIQSHNFLLAARFKIRLSKKFTPTNLQ